MSYLDSERNTFNIQTNIDNSPSAQTSSSLWQDLAASDITYNCYGNPSFVMYEYTTSINYSTYSYATLDFKLIQYNTSTSSWEDVNASQQVSWGMSGGGYPGEFKTFTFILDSWDGDKQLKAQWKKVSGGAKVQYAYTINTNGSGVWHNPKPFLIVKSIK